MRRVINYDENKPDIDLTLRTPESDSLYKESWPLRRALIDNQNNTIKSILTIEQLNSLTRDKAKPYPLFIDGKFLNSILRAANLNLHYDEFIRGLYCQRPVNYYITYSPGTPLESFIDHMKQKPGYNVIHKKIVRSNSKFISNDDNNNSAICFDSLAAHIATDLMSAVYEDENIDYLLLLTRETDLLPAINKIRNVGIKIVLVSSDNVPVSANIYRNVDHVIMFSELCKNLNCLEPNARYQK